ncbi:phospholipase D family protein [Agrobacterium tumefaciens]|uniref:phospholipase D family protein n=1 Tax=Agrobacterium tumefaciens TaxID=358 RepID=UPI0022068DB1|nr:hypothetical protein FY131_27095 [Agrobacterium tumefaciens]
MTEFLDEIAAREVIRSTLSKTDTATLVVAFWGTGAIESLGLDKEWKSLRVVCNLDSGACNPDEIGRLTQLHNVDVRTDWRLHGKVYLAPDALVMGSSNASSNGLVIEGAAALGWAEANIVSHDSGLIKQLTAWCDERFTQAIKVGPHQLELARVTWNARRDQAPVPGNLTSDLLDLVKRQSDHPAFSNIKVVQWGQETSEHAQEVFDETIRTDGSLKGTSFYEGWGDAMAVGDWLIDFDKSRGKSKFTGYWTVVYVDKDNDITFVRKSPAIDIAAIGRLTVAKDDQNQLAARLRDSIGTERGVYEKIAHLSQLITAGAAT